MLFTQNLHSRESIFYSVCCTMLALGIGIYYQSSIATSMVCRGTVLPPRGRGGEALPTPRGCFLGALFLRCVHFKSPKPTAKLDICSLSRDSNNSFYWPTVQTSIETNSHTSNIPTDPKLNPDLGNVTQSPSPDTES